MHHDARGCAAAGRLPFPCLCPVVVGRTATGGHGSPDWSGARRERSLKQPAQGSHRPPPFVCLHQVVTAEQWAARGERFPEEPPKSKEYYLLRSIFQRHFPSRAAYDTVPRVRAVTACHFSFSTVQALQSPSMSVAMLDHGQHGHMLPSVSRAVMLV